MPNNSPPAGSNPVDEGGALAKVYGENLHNPDALINRANKRATNGDLDGALGDFDEAIALNPAKATAYFNRGFLFNSLGKFEAAIHDFSEAIELLPDYDEAYFQRGNSYRQRGEFQRAIQDYSQAIRINPYCIKAYYKRADSRAELGDHPGALTDFSQVILRLPKDANAYCQRGMFLSQSGELEKAIEDFTSAIEHNPRLADAYFHRGYCLAQMGEAEKASKDFSEALLHDPNHQAAYTRAYALGMLKEAPVDVSSPSSTATDYPLSLLEESVPVSVEPVEDSDDEQEPHPATVPLEPTSMEGFFERANNRIQRGDLDGAISDYSKIIDNDPENSQAYYQRGQSLGALGESQAAMEDLNQAIHWARVHSLGLIRDFSGELSTTLETLKQDLKELSYQSPFAKTHPLPPGTATDQLQSADPPANDVIDSSSEQPDASGKLKTVEHSNAEKTNSSNTPPTSAKESVVTDIVIDPHFSELEPSSSVAQGEPPVPPPPASPQPSPPAPEITAPTLERAIAQHTRAIEQNPLDAEAFFNRGQSRALGGDLQGAIEDYSRTIRLDPNNREAYVKRARCLSALGDEAAAQADLNHVIRQSPKRPQPQPLNTASAPSTEFSYPQAAPSPAASTRPSPPQVDDATHSMASLFQQENEILQATQTSQKSCTHEGNSPGNQFCIHCGASLSPLDRYSSNFSASPPDFPPGEKVKPVASNRKQRLQEAEQYYDQGVALFRDGDRQGSLQSLSAGLKIFLEQREMQRYQQTLNFMQDVAHALNDTGEDEADPDDSLLL
ncbi:tetratricopeptide repeat protein [Acaryochloris sp. CCMEE 5410]|uniref:tetratricopeptide repeat protein n=1 Tax=Acaryochloris sp. CCMEE 5410 TaxID=310037 RepID=UPI0002483C21|nr:tetratricopeptide repeat protein [Acaryochloris sp. CCMEE 5410]KAI9131196.1 tetratricopeptide repeat protein [Acaryochloris sp. CCMEE 5410]